MALILKQGKKFSPQMATIYGTNLDGSTYYANISEVTLRVKDRNATFSVAIYADVKAKEELKSNIDIKNYQADDDDFDTYFSNKVLNKRDIVSACYDYIADNEDWTDWKSDE